MRLLVEGRPQKAVADDLGLSVRTVQTYLDRAKLKLRVHTCTQLIVVVAIADAQARTQ